MSSTTTPAVAAGRTTTGGTALRRGGAVLLAAVAAVVVWVVAVALAGADLRTPEGDPIGWYAFAAAALAASLAGWALLEVLERLTRHAGRIWTAAAVLVLLASFSGPFGMPGLDTSTRVWLAVGHVAVAAVLVPLVLRTVRAPRG